MHLDGSQIQDPELTEAITFVSDYQDSNDVDYWSTLGLSELIVAFNKTKPITGETSDGYHTFNELYEFRKVFNAVLFNEWAAQGKYHVHKSKRHFDHELCFGGGWFIVVAQLPDGQISNHYEEKDWELFNIPESERALFPFDGHTGKDVIERLIHL